VILYIAGLFNGIHCYFSPVGIRENASSDHLVKKKKIIMLFLFKLVIRIIVITIINIGMSVTDILVNSLKSRLDFNNYILLINSSGDPLDNNRDRESVEGNINSPRESAGSTGSEQGNQQEENGQEEDQEMLSEQNSDYHSEFTEDSSASNYEGNFEVQDADGEMDQDDPNPNSDSDSDTNSTGSGNTNDRPVVSPAEPRSPGDIAQLTKDNDFYTLGSDSAGIGIKSKTHHQLADQIVYEENKVREGSLSKADSKLNEMYANWEKRDKVEDAFKGSENEDLKTRLDFLDNKYPDYREEGPSRCPALLEKSSIEQNYPSAYNQSSPANQAPPLNPVSPEENMETYQAQSQGTPNKRKLEQSSDIEEDIPSKKPRFGDNGPPKDGSGGFGGPDASGSGPGGADASGSGSNNASKIRIEDVNCDLQNSIEYSEISNLEQSGLLEKIYQIMDIFF
jgi:hypothetical protein